MLLDTRLIDRDPRIVDRALDLGQLVGEGGLPLTAGPVRFRAVACRGPAGVTLEGELAGTLVLSCSRCLERYETPLSAQFRLTLVAAVEPPPEADGSELDVGLDDEAADRFEAPGGVADLAAVAAEQIYLSVPLKPLCTPDCRGLCPACGAPRNRIECACPRGEPDPRLAPLLEWKQRQGRR